VKRALVLSFVALAISVAGASAAGAASVSVEQYVNSVCTSVTAFSEASDQATQTFQNDTATSTKVSQVKPKFVAFFESLHDAVTQLQADLKAAGTPQLAHGSAIAKQLRSVITSMEAVVADARDTAADLKTSSPKQFAKSATALGTKLDKAFSNVGDGFDGLPKRFDTSSLTAAQQADADCAILN
jgi:predicted O-linked N-acetylglucosamine transferase (SPINDLY family)